MKKNLCMLIVLMLCLAPILGLCEGGMAAQTGSWTQINQSLAPDEGWQRIVTDTAAFQLGEKTPLEGSEGLYIGDWGAYPSIDGSTVCVPMAMEFARQWLAMEEGDLNGFVNFSTTPYAYDRLTNGQANPLVTIVSQGVMMDDAHPIDIVIGTGPNEDERNAFDDAGVEYVMVPVCYDAFVFLVNAENTVETLTEQQIQQIYTGALTRWSEVGGEEGLFIQPYQRPHGSGSQTAMEEMVMKEYNLTAAEPNYISDGMGDLIAQVGNYDNGRAALGYSYLYYVDALYKSGDIKVLAVNGVAPTPENLRSGAYPYTVNYYAVYVKGNENAEAFVNWMISEEGQAVIGQAGYVTLY